MVPRRATVLLGILPVALLVAGAIPHQRTDEVTFPSFPDARRSAPATFAAGSGGGWWGYGDGYGIVVDRPWAEAVGRADRDLRAAGFRRVATWHGLGEWRRGGDQAFALAEYAGRTPVTMKSLTVIHPTRPVLATYALLRDRLGFR